MGGMVNDASVRPRLTPKGERTRARIVEKAAALIHERGVAATTLEDVKVAAEVSGSQMYHYFPDKNELVQAVIDYQADTIVNNNRHALGSAKAVEAWRDMVVTGVRHNQGKGGLRARFARWSTSRERPRGPSPHRGRVRSVGCRHQRWTAIPTGRREALDRHRPGRPRHYSARHAPRRASPRPGATQYPPARNCGRHPPRSHHGPVGPRRKVAGSAGGTMQPTKKALSIVLAWLLARRTTGPTVYVMVGDMGMTSMMAGAPPLGLTMMLRAAPALGSAGEICLARV